MDLGAAVGSEVGVTTAQFEQLLVYETSQAFDDRERLCLRYADAMTTVPVDLSDELHQALRGHFSEEQIIELTAVIAWENHRARFAHALGLESGGFADGATCAVPVRT